ncbi:MAG TPA: biotin-dependent carboxyltransferase family protein [Chitinophagaceae bacterium]|nr:biotin-dependent carboxyltransferase family protein [Chitinophagaceae bacterium]
MSVKIIKAGILDTIQDAGRFGYQHLGINPTGAMDIYAMQVANMLVGNDPKEAVIEMHFPAAAFLFTQPALIAISGADLTASINGEEIPHHHPIIVGRNDVLQFHKPVDGARAYLAIAGGIEIKEWMNSSSTHLKAKAGGYEGRNLRKEDELFFKRAFSQKNKNSFTVLPWQADIHWIHDSKEMLVLPGNEWERLTTGSKENFTMTSFVITQQSDRMGYRLNNIPLPVMKNEEVISTAVSFGTVQLLPDGKLIVLMADHQTTGGYPRIAHVISAHHSRLAQLRAGDKIHFQFTDQHTAEELWLRQQQHLLQLQNACTFRLQEYFSK